MIGHPSLLPEARNDGPCATRRRTLAAALSALAAPHVARAQSPNDWITFRNRFVTDSGRVIDSGNQAVSHSEGQGWGLMFAAAHDDRDSFDLIRKWTRETLKRPQDNLHAWRYRPTATPHVDDPNNATDGDLYILWGLLMAAERWQHAPYRIEALTIAHDLMRVARRTVAGLAVLLPGVQGFDSPAGTVLNPSYIVLPAFAVLHRLLPQAGWSRIATDGLTLLRRARFGAWGLSPDWVRQPHRANLPLDLPERWPPRFSYDAVRVPLMLAWANHTTHPALIGAHHFWSDSRWTVPPAWVDLVTGSTAEYPAPPGMRAIAAFAAARIAGATEVQGLPSVNDSQDYYSASLTLLVRLACGMSGLRIG
ncbi:glycosyl hydrolase family 8 [Neoroseomonas alba]|uniref:glycosyl hydrolase family 8 n=1 Tax=Roseomonas alba TaxID=2846776 RepID=UPI00210825E3|nr:glycosyl hydrolase family 8 [Neoroseomonas alba]